MMTDASLRPHPAVGVAAPVSAVALDGVRDRLAVALGDASGTGPSLGRFNTLLIRLLEALAANTTATREYLAEHGTALQSHLVTRLIDLFDAYGAGDRFACEAVAAAITTMAADALVGPGPINDEEDSVLALRRPLVHFAARSLC